MTSQLDEKVPCEQHDVTPADGKVRLLQQDDYDVILCLIIGLWLRLECSLDSLSIDSAHVIYVSEGYDVAYNRRTASQPSHVVLRVTWYVKTFRNVNYVC